MKIAMVVEHYSKQGGHNRAVAELAERIADYHEVHIFAHSFNDLENKRIITHHVPMFKKPALLMIISFILNSTCLLRKQKFDIIHSVGPNAIIQNIITDQTTQRTKVKALSRFIKNKKRNFIHRLHDAMVHALICKIEQIIYSPRGNRKVIAVSKGVQREIFEYYGKSLDEIAVIPNGVDLKKFHPRNRVLYRTELRKDLNITKTDFVVLFVGGDWERKGLEYIIRALSLLEFQKLKLLVVGEWFNREYFTKIAQNLQISDRVVWFGKSSKVEKLYATVDLLVFPTFYEAFSLVTLEAMASGLPLLATKVNGTEDLIKEGLNGYFISHNTSDIARKIKVLMNDSYLLESMGCCARKTAEQYSWDRMAGEVMKVYEEVVRTRKN